MVIQTDLHSHLLPGVDDGAGTLAESLELIRWMHGMGFRRLYTTPHVMQDMYPNSRERLEEAAQLVWDALPGLGLDVELHLAAEYYVDEYFEKKLETEPLLTLPGRRVLIEHSPLAAPPNFHQVVFRLCAKGYKPVLAHPERYRSYESDLGAYQRLKQWGCEFQVNLLSLTGYYGRTVEKNARLLMKAGLTDFLATDLHHRRHAELLEKAFSDKQVKAALEHPSIRNESLA